MFDLIQLSYTSIIKQIYRMLVCLFLLCVYVKKKKKLLVNMSSSDFAHSNISIVISFKNLVLSYSYIVIVTNLYDKSIRAIK